MELWWGRVRLVLCWLCLILPATGFLRSKGTGLSSTLSSSVGGGESVHLKLQEVLQGTDGEGDDTKSVEKLGFGVLTSIVNGSTQETILSAQGHLSNATVLRLGHFALHRLGINVTTYVAHPLRLEQRVFDLRLNSSLNELHDLFRSERLLLQDKEFPPREPFVDGEGGEAEEGKTRKFEGKLFASARRLLAMRQQDLGWSVGDTGPTEPPETRSVREFLEAQPSATLEGWRRRPGVSHAESISRLKTFLEFFRNELPYYYSACLESDCSYKGKDNMYLGCVYPRQDEVQDRAGVTELNLCACCQRVSRFPRFNALGAMLRTRRGRCGEYSVLCMKMLELLGYGARWVVDWADHVWCEVALSAEGQDDGRLRWVHVDPCEASIDEPLLYEGWGKNATFIFAIGKDGPVEDVTWLYTSAPLDEVHRRREREGVNSTFVGAAVSRASLLWSGA